MLAITISTFFALAFLGAVTVIAMMFFQYRDRISDVILGELDGDRSGAAMQPRVLRQRTGQAHQLMSHHRSPRPAPLRVAA